MPELSRFLGLMIKMVLLDHGIPHFHVYYGRAHRGRGGKRRPAAQIDIRNAKLLSGSLPRPQLNYVIAWTYLHQAELLAAWDLAKQGLLPRKIAPLKK